jgi:hypothetical protein
VRAVLVQTPYSWTVANNNKHRPAGSAASPAKKQAAKTPEPMSRSQRLLAYVGGSLLGFGILALIALLLGESFALKSVQADIGIWAVIAFIPDIAIPAGFVLFIILIVITYRRRARSAEGAGK